MDKEKKWLFQDWKPASNVVQPFKWEWVVLIYYNCFIVVTWRWHQIDITLSVAPHKQHAMKLTIWPSNKRDKVTSTVYGNFFIANF